MFYWYPWFITALQPIKSPQNLNKLINQSKCHLSDFHWKIKIRPRGLSLIVDDDEDELNPIISWILRSNVLLKIKSCHIRFLAVPWNYFSGRVFIASLLYCLQKRLQHFVNLRSWETQLSFLCIILHYNMYYFHFILQEPC